MTTFASRVGFAITLSLATVACNHKSSTTSSDATADPGMATPPLEPTTVAATTSAPTQAPSPAYTGPATLERGDAPLAGRIAPAGTFVTCDGTTLTILATDVVYEHGTCAMTYDLRLRSAAQQAASGTGPGTPLINGIAVDGDTAIATYVRGGQTGQVLLERAGSTWVAKDAVAGALRSGDASSAGIEASRLRRLQNKLPFDVGATPLPKP